MYIKEFVPQVNDFSGGLITKRREINNMKINTTPDSADVFADLDGALHKRYGVTKLNSAQVGAGTKDGNGLYDYEGTLIGSFGTTYYKMEEMDGTWDSLQTGMEDAHIQCENYLSNLIIANWNQDYVKTMQKTDTTMSNLTTTNAAGRGKYPKIYKDHLLMSGVPGYPYTFFYSQVSDFDDFENGGTWPVQTNDGDELSGWGELEDRLYAFKWWSIHQLTFRGGTPYWSRRQISSGVGTRSPLTIQNVTLSNGEEVIMFLGSNKKIYQFDGYNATAVSPNFEENNGISPISMETLNWGAIRDAHAIVDTKRHWYVLFVANGGATNMTHGLIYNYYTGACWPFTNQGYRTSCNAFDPIGRKWNIVADYDGYAYRWHYGTKDDSTTISPYHTTPRFILKPGTLNQQFEVILTTNQRTDDALDFQFRTDYYDPWSAAESIPLYGLDGEYYLGVSASLGTGTLGPDQEVRQRTIGLDVQSQNVQFRLSDGNVTEPWVLNAYEFVGRAIGITRQVEWK